MLSRVVTSYSPIERHLEEIYAACLLNTDGAVADYIPELGEVDQDKFGICLTTADGHTYSYGDTEQLFTIQSISKPLTYGLALMDNGIADVDEMVGIEPSGEAFNEISLDPVTERARNPMINAGAIATSSLIRGSDVKEQFERVLAFYSSAAGRTLDFSHAVYESEAKTGHRNRAIAHMLRSVDALRGQPDEALELYFRQCSIEISCHDLAMIAATLANAGTNPITGESVLDGTELRRVLSVMATCGMYDAAGDWLTTVGMPAKSGVGGGIFAVLPGQLGIAVYSPRLDQIGHTSRGVQACRMLSEVFELHFLAVPHAIRNTIRAVTPHGDAVVYELQGDLLFAGVESVLRQTRDADTDNPVVVLDVIRVDQVSNVAKTILWEYAADVREAGRELVLVDPDRMFMPDEDSGADAILSFDNQAAALDWAAT